MIEDIRWVRGPGGLMYLEACDGHQWFPVKDEEGLAHGFATTAVTSSYYLNTQSKGEEE
jgi:hypothetical protein